MNVSTTRTIYFAFALAFLILAIRLSNVSSLPAKKQTVANPRAALIRQLLVKYDGRKPKQWSQCAVGVYTRLASKDKTVALTFDACGGPHGSSFDSRLISYLEAEHIPAILFLSARWIEANPDVTRRLGKNPLFEIGDHGWKHRPCSVTGRSEYGIHGTRSAREVVDEVEKDSDEISRFTHHRPEFYRSGTDCYDEIGAQIVRKLGYKIIGYTISGDAGATYSAKQVKEALLDAPSGSIILCHMNHPNGHTAAGLMAAIPILRQRGYKFVRLSEHLKDLK